MTVGAWLYPHDLERPGVADVVRAAGLEQVCVAASYHQLLATAPTEDAHRVLDLPTSALYFRPDPAVWSGVVPAVRFASDLGGDALVAGRRFADRVGAQLCAWLVCLHGDGAEWTDPDLAVRTVTGDVVAGAPCLTAGPVREHVRRLVRDAGNRSDAVQLESLHWLAQPHARHAKIDGAAPRLSRLAMSVCFCRRCRDDARSRGVDADLVARRLDERWRAAWDALAPDDPRDVDGLEDFLAARAGVVTDLVAEVVATSPVAVEVVVFGDQQLNGVDPAALRTAGADVRVLAYGTSELVSTTVAALSERPNPVHLGLSVLPEHVATEAAARDAVRAAAGAESIRLYHLGLAGPRRRSWLPDLAAAWRHAREGATR